MNKTHYNKQYKTTIKHIEYKHNQTSNNKTDKHNVHTWKHNANTHNKIAQEQHIQKHTNTTQSNNVINKFSMLIQHKTKPNKRRAPNQYKQNTITNNNYKTNHTK